MDGDSRSAWRVVVFTNIPGGGVYHMTEEVLQPLGHRVVGVVTTPGPPRRRSTDYLSVVSAVKPGVDVIVSTHMHRLAAMLAPLRPDLIISGGFTWLIPSDVIALPRLGAINMHPSFLPRHRGPHAIEWAFRSGDAEIGFTVHRLDVAFDTGAILAQQGIPITDEDDAHSILAKFPGVTPSLLRHALGRVAQGDPGEPQDESQATYAGALEHEWRVIDWGQPSRTVHNQVRSWTGLRGMPLGAIGNVDNSPLTVIRTRLGNGAEPSPASPGTVLFRNDDRIVVQCGDGPIEIVEWETVA
jgi:methionyl-tRNA formyltransferase